MKKRTDKHYRVNLLLMVTAMLAAIFLAYAPSYAACNVSGDNDCDGLIDNPEETNGIVLCDGTLFNGLALNAKDLFVIVTPENPNSRMANISNRLEFLSTVVRPHEIEESQAGCAAADSRSVTANQKAARVRERLDTADTSGTDDSLGWTDAVGPANGPIPFGDAYVYTERIASWVNQQCGRNCRTSDSAANGVDEVTNRFIKHTTAHETGHMLNLKQLPDSKIGNHYAASTRGDRYTLDQYVFVKSGVFYMGTIFNNPIDSNNAQVR